MPARGKVFQLLLAFACIVHLSFWKAQAASSSSSFFSGKRKAEDEWKTFSKNLYIKNRLPATEAKENIEKADLAGAQGYKLKGKTGKKNAARTLQRAFQKENPWCKKYWAEIPVLNRKTNKTKLVWYPFLVPHEWLSLYCADPLALHDLEPAVGSKYHKHRADVARELGLPAESIVVLGLHGDGVPVQGTHNVQSLDCFALNMPTSLHNSDLRVPFTVIQKKHQVSDETIHAILEIFCWSMRALIAGEYPDERHDARPWLASDGARKKLKGSLPAKAVLAEIRGDWDFYETILKFPAYNKLSGMCWMCTETYKTFRDLVSKPALTSGAFFRRLRSDGKAPTVIFSLPGVTPDICRPDWMHTADQGVSADIAAHTLMELMQEQPGNTKQERCQNLWVQLQKWYDATGVEKANRFDNLVPNMFAKKNSTQALRQSSTHQEFRPLAACDLQQVLDKWL
jgi:hypothetical protein